MSISIRWLDHTAIAVHSIEDALPFYRDVLGGDPQELSHSPNNGFSALTLRYPHGGGIELITPLGPSGFVHDFLARRGEGVHHITFLVNDLRAAVAEAKAAGLRVVAPEVGVVVGVGALSERMTSPASQPAVPLSPRRRSLPSSKRNSSSS